MIPVPELRGSAWRGVLLAALFAFLFARHAGLAATITVTYDATDCTANLQAALNDASADIIIVPFTGSAWTTGPLVLARSNVTLRFEPGVELLAKNGAFPVGSPLLQVQLCQNVTISGYGATFRMLNGTDTSYDTEENRHCLGLRGVDHVLVEGIKCTKAGGDGIYISGGWVGADPTYSGNVTVQDCTLDDNRRQGISVISAQDLIIQRCVMSNTGATNGTDPMAGIDFEPDLPVQRLVNCRLRDCSLFGNRAVNYATGILTYLGNLDAGSSPVSIQIERCHITSTQTGSDAVNLSGPKDGGPAATYTMTDCLIEDTRGSGLYLNSGLATTTTQITRTVLRNTFTDIVTWNNGGTPIYLEGQFQDINAYGNITFTDCLIVDSKPRSFIRSYEDRSYLNMSLPDTWCDGLRGNITVINPNAEGHVFNLDINNDLNTTLAVTALASMPAQTVGVSCPTPATSEGSATLATMTVTRSAADVSFALAVDLDWSGTTLNGNDYAYRPGFVILPPMAASAQLTLNARADGIANGGKTVIATLAPRDDYTIATGAEAATLHIFDTPLPAWRFNVFGDAANAGNAADTADPAHDGLPNLLKYALGGNPAIADATSIIPAASIVAEQLQFTFKCDAARTDIACIVQASDDLIAWTDIASSTGGATTVALNGSGAIISDTGIGQRIVTVTDAQMIAPDARHFLRLKVMAP